MPYLLFWRRQLVMLFSRLFIDNEKQNKQIQKNWSLLDSLMVEASISGAPITQDSQVKDIVEKQVDGIWKAFQSIQFRKRFENRLIADGEIKSQAVFKMRHFYNKVRDADNGGIFRRRLNECKTFKEMEIILTDLFEEWKNNLKYIWVRKLFFDYLGFLREIYIAQGNLDDSKEDNLTKSSKIQLTYRDGTIVQLNPIDALKKVVLLIGPERVSQMNLRVIGDKLIVKHKPFNAKYYEIIEGDWWLLNKGTPKAKYQNIYIMLQRYNSLGIKAKLL